MTTATAITAVSGRIVTPEGVITGEVICQHGVIIEIRATDALAVEDQWVCAGFIDLQLNGTHGVDLTHRPEGLPTVARQLTGEGTTAFLPTVITCDDDRRSVALDTLGPMVAEVAEEAEGAAAVAPSATPLGIHLEGPLLSPQRRGAHPAQHLDTVAACETRRWTRARGVAMVTLAPELDGAVDLISVLRRDGVVVALGHSDAAAEQFQAGIAAGATYVTHLFNAMRPFSHRDPGPIGAVLADSEVIAGLICDGLHVDPVAVAMAWRSLGPERIDLVTDAVAARGTGNFPTGVRTPDGVLAGSALDLDEALRRLIRATGANLVDAIRTVTSTPAQVLGLGDRGRIQVGCRADLTVLSAKLQVLETYVGGACGGGGPPAPQR